MDHMIATGTTSGKTGMSHTGINVVKRSDPSCTGNKCSLDGDLGTSPPSLLWALYYSQGHYPGDTTCRQLHEVGGMQPLAVDGTYRTSNPVVGPGVAHY